MAKNAKDEEQMRKMQQYVNKMTEDNFKLKQQLDDQRETSIWNKKLLDEYISNITTQGGLVEKLQSTIETLYSKIDAQQKIIDHLQDDSPRRICSPRGMIERSSDREDLPIQRPPAPIPCKYCGGSGRANPLPLDPTSTKNQEEMMMDLQSTKDQLRKLLEEVQHNNQETGEGAGGEAGETQKSLINFKDMDNLQSLLDQAADCPDEMLLFCDSQGTVWQIIRRLDLAVEDLMQGEGTPGVGGVELAMEVKKVKQVEEEVKERVQDGEGVKPLA